jgi:hypothetical protein
MFSLNNLLLAAETERAFSGRLHAAEMLPSLFSVSLSLLYLTYENGSTPGQSPFTKKIGL